MDIIPLFPFTHPFHLVKTKTLPNIDISAVKGYFPRHPLPGAGRPGAESYQKYYYSK